MSQTTDTETDPSSDDSTAFHAIIEAAPIKDYLEPMATIADETRIHIEDNGIRSRMPDPANVAMCDVELSADAFEAFDPGQPGGTLGINIERLEDVLGFADPDDLVEFELDAETRMFTVRIGTEYEFELALIDPDAIQQEPDSPDVPVKTKAVVAGRDISRGIKASDMTSDFVQLITDADADEVILKAQGDLEKSRVSYGTDDRIDDGLDADTRSLYSLNYLRDFNTSIPADAEVVLHLGEEVPILIDFEFSDGNGDVRFMLAPRFEKN